MAMEEQKTTGRDHRSGNRRSSPKVVVGEGAGGYIGTSSVMKQVI